MNVYHLHRCRSCGTSMLSWHHLVCLSCALTRDCSRWIPWPTREISRRARA